MPTKTIKPPPTLPPCPASVCRVDYKSPLSITGLCHCKCVLMTMTHDTKQKGTHWSVTQFGIAEGEEQMAFAHQRGWAVQGQQETCPTTDRKHWQLYVHTPHTRMSQVIKHFRGAHVEPARNVPALQHYVVKEETRSGELPDLSKYPTLNDFWTLTHGLMTGGATDPEWEAMQNSNPNGVETCAAASADSFLERACDEEANPPSEATERIYNRPQIWCIARILVRRGYHVEMLVANPQLKEAWNQTFWACLLRTHNAIKARRQTEQTDTAVIPTHVEDTTNAVPSEAHHQAEGGEA